MIDINQHQHVWDMVELKYLCVHTDSEVRKKTIRNGSFQYVRQCIKCGESLSSPISHSLVSGNTNPYDDQLAINYNNRRVEEYKQRTGLEKDISDAAWWSWYSDYLNSDSWKRKRSLVIARSRGHCEGCGCKAATQVHHLTYDRAGDEMLFDLVAICDECHEKLHRDDDHG